MRFAALDGLGGRSRGVPGQIALNRRTKSRLSFVLSRRTKSRLSFVLSRRTKSRLSFVLSRRTKFHLPFVLSLSKDGTLVEFMAFYVYILRCSDGSYYTGHTEDLESRLAAHTDGTFHGYTHTRLPVQLVFSEEFPARYEALSRERQIKGWSRAKKEALVKGDWDAVQMLARSRCNTLRYQTNAELRVRRA